MIEDEAEPVALDVTGQPGGPSPEEQARVDAEQRELMDRMAAERAPQEAADRLAMQEKIQRAIDAQSENRALIERVKQLEARVTVLEARNG